MIGFKHIFISILLVFESIAAMAQVGEPRRDFSIGGTVGYTLNRVSFVPRIKQAYKGSPMFGFATRFVCEKYFKTICAVQLEAQYCNLGWKEVIEDGTNNQYYRDMHYIQVPILMQMGWGRERKGFKFIFELGPQLGIYLSGTEHKDAGGEGSVWDPTHRPNSVNYQYDKDVDNKFDYGIAGGAGLEFSSPIGHFIIGGRFYYGLGDFFDNSKKGKFGRSANQTISVRLAYLFDIIRTQKTDIK